MSYETPKPSFSQEHESPSPNPEAQNSELETLAGELSLEDPLVNENQPVTSTSRDNPDYAASLTTTFLNQIEVIDLTGDDEKSSGDHIAQTRIVAEEQDAKAADQMLMPDLLNQDFALSRQLRRDGQFSRAAQQYLKGLRSYIGEGGAQSIQMIDDLVAELLQCLEDVEPFYVPALACDCLDLLHRLQLKFPLTSRTHHLVSSALERLLVAHPEIPRRVNFDPVVWALDDQDISTPLQGALRSLLTRMRNRPFTKDARIECQFRICLLAFACNLRECLKKDPWGGGVSALKTTTWTLLGMGNLLDSLFARMLTLSRWGEFSRPLYRFEVNLSNDLESVSRGYLFVEPSVTKMADACSLNGWGYEAELLFAILRSTQSSNIVPNIRRFKTSITYCLHLEREKRYEKLLDLLSLLYKDLEDFSRWFWAYRKYGYDTLKKDEDILQKAEVDIRNILNRISGRPGQGISSEMALEITKSRRLFEAVQRGILTSKREDRSSRQFGEEFWPPKEKIMKIM